MLPLVNNLTLEPCREDARSIKVTHTEISVDRDEVGLLAKLDTAQFLFTAEGFRACPTCHTSGPLRECSG